MRLTEEQKHVIRQIVKNKDNIPVQTLGGYAGTGKSVIVSFLHRALPRFAVCAFTGKATNIVRRKGIHTANTIHSTIYRPYKDINDKTVWNLASKWDLNDIEGFLIDEASMVGSEIDRDLKSFGKPIVYVGDHGQLEPIGGTSFNLMANPMYKLEQVHRNAGEIAYFAEHLRKGLLPRKFKTDKSVQIVKEKMILPRHLSNTDQVICAFNKTRVELNQKIRSERGIEFSYIAIGEKIICLRNKRDQRLFNGMQGTVTKIRPNNHFDFIADGEHFYNIQYDPDQFGQETNNFDFKNQANPFDYGYALTAHKAQGDQFGNVIVYEQKCERWNHVRWAYTAASRAIRGLIWVEEESYLPSYLA